MEFYPRYVITDVYMPGNIVTTDSEFVLAWMAAHATTSTLRIMLVGVSA